MVLLPSVNQGRSVGQYPTAGGGGRDEGGQGPLKAVSFFAISSVPILLLLGAFGCRRYGAPLWQWDAAWLCGRGREFGHL